jgi:hypothetical protein
MASKTIRNYRSLMRKVWLHIQGNPGAAAPEMWAASSAITSR